jgi:hypothetical protein
MPITFDNPVFATIHYTDNHKGFALARNGGPESIYCPVNSGFFRIIAKGDLLVPDYSCRTTFIPKADSRVVIIKAPRDANQKHEKAAIWAPESAYLKAVAYRNRTSVIYIAIAVNYRDNGRIINNRKRDELFRGTMIRLEGLPADELDKLVEHYSTTIVADGKRRTFTYDTTWKKVVNGEEVECDSPLAELALH